MKPDELTREEKELIEAILEKVLSGINLGFDIAELNVLDDVNASKRTIQELGTKIAVNNTELSAAILEIAHSVYFGHHLQLQGEVPDFFDAVIRMGADRVKLLIFSLTLFSLGKGPAAKQRAAKSAAIGLLGRIIAEQMGLKEELVRKIETGGLLSQMGRNILIKAQELGSAVSDETVQKLEAPMATALIEKLDLDPFLRKAADLSVVEFDEESFALSGIIKLAEALTEDSFRRFGKLVLKSPMPDKAVVLMRSPGLDIQKLFAILGIEEYLEIWEMPTQRQREALARKTKGKTTNQV